MTTVTRTEAPSTVIVMSSGQPSSWEAHAKMAELKKEKGHYKKGSPEKKSSKKGDENLEGMWKRLQAAVKSGRITQEEAEDRMAELKRKKGER